MKKNLMFKIIVLSFIVPIFCLLITGCCSRCCSPSIEVGMIPVGTTSHYQPSKISVHTWNSTTTFPGIADHLVTDNIIDPLKPYLFKANVTNFSDVEVRGVVVEFGWYVTGLSDLGTPIGSAAVDLPAGSSKWVISPWTVIPFESGIRRHVCMTAHVFHPCDTDLDNNWCFSNLNILDIDDLLMSSSLPFVVGFEEAEGLMQLAITAPANIKARILSKTLSRGKVDSKEIADLKPVSEITVVKGVIHEMSLVIDCSKSDFKPGETFDVTVKAVQKGVEVSSFIARCNIKKQ